ncbi:hypothetical protein WJX84_009275 [Apatococcus fuscideae]|uniref:Protein phosphatase n=1 Tax=Apatococcus fuscideae TaxID=2026836 RepID=A0AAW1T037_9CHLO
MMTGLILQPARSHLSSKRRLATPCCTAGSISAHQASKTPRAVSLSKGSKSKRSKKRTDRAPAGLKVRAVTSVEEERETSHQSNLQTQKLSLVVGTFSLPHPDKASYGGEDAHFVSSSALAIGVADGVGGWGADGINPAEYSRMLMRLTQQSLESAISQPPSAQPDSSSSSSMPSEAASRDSPSINSAVLGDSIFMHVRDRQVLHRATPGLHFFDCPFQFGNAPEHTSGTDTADDADMATLSVQPGDILVMATDGVWDNMQDADILGLLPIDASGLDGAAQDIGDLARRNALDPEYDSPYAAEARKAGLDLPWWEKVSGGRISAEGFKLAALRGGKLDDITVVLGMVVAS